MHELIVLPRQHVVHLQLCVLYEPVRLAEEIEAVIETGIHQADAREETRIRAEIRVRCGNRVRETEIPSVAIDARVPERRVLSLPDQMRGASPRLRAHRVDLVEQETTVEPKNAVGVLTVDLVGVDEAQSRLAAEATGRGENVEGGRFAVGRGAGVGQAVGGRGAAGGRGKGDFGTGDFPGRLA